MTSAPFKTNRNIPIHYTPNDYRTLMALQSVADADGTVKIRNTELGLLIGTRGPAAASRLFRLERLGLVSIAYDHSRTGRKIVDRQIRVHKVPPPPFDPEPEEALHAPQP